MKDLTLPRKVVEQLNENVSVSNKNKASTLLRTYMELLVKITKHFSNEVKWIVILTEQESETRKDT